MIDIEHPIYEINTFPKSNELIGIIIGQSSENQLHCGIAYKNNNNISVIHLAWHFFLSHENDFNGFKNYYWIKSSIHSIRQYSIAALCRRIIKRNNEQRIPYGLIYNGGRFSSDGILVLDSTESGLTCATFVLAVFKSCDILLIDIKNWQTRESDKEWHNSIIRALISTKERFNISEVHIVNVSKEVGCSRFRPEEVAISSSFDLIPESTEKIIESGLLLKNFIEKK